jgi:hypothetical protein
VHNFSKNINNLALSYLGGKMWEVNIHHVPPSGVYKVLVLIDREYLGKYDIKRLPENTKIINSVGEIEKNKINLMFLNAQNIEKAFEGIYIEDELKNKPLELGERVWKDERKIIELLMNTSANSKQIYDIIDWAIKISNN